VRLHYVSRGTGPLIIFLHGFPEFWYAWRDQLVEFGRDHRAVAVDMRGFNLSSKPTGVEAYEIRALVEDIRALADHLGAPKFVLVGHDWGGGVAWAFAMAHPERLEKLVIINATHPAMLARELAQNPVQQRASQYMLLFRSPDAERILSANNYARLLASFSDLRQPGTFTSADSAEYVSAWSQPGALTGGLNYYRAARVGPPTPGTAPWVPKWAPNSDMRVSVPTLVIWGEQDRFLVPDNLTGLEAYVPNLTVKRIPDATHWVVRERPAEVSALIRDFIR
jgi:pimeloyl-ACP methyl ester carboxylesterase